MGRARQGPLEDAKPFEKAMAIHLGELIEKAGHTLDTLAEAIGTSRGTVGHWLRARYMPPLADWPKLAAALKLKRVNQLVPTTFDPPPDGPKE